MRLLGSLFASLWASDRSNGLGRKGSRVYHPIESPIESFGDRRLLPICLSHYVLRLSLQKGDDVVHRSSVQKVYSLRGLIGIVGGEHHLLAR